jgi:hypothetical protein
VEGVRRRRWMERPAGTAADLIHLTSSPSDDGCEPATADIVMGVTVQNPGRTGVGPGTRIQAGPCPRTSLLPLDRARRRAGGVLQVIAPPDLTHPVGDARLDGLHPRRIRPGSGPWWPRTVRIRGSTGVRTPGSDPRHSRPARDGDLVGENALDAPEWSPVLQSPQIPAPAARAGRPIRWPRQNGQDGLDPGS